MKKKEKKESQENKVKKEKKKKGEKKKLKWLKYVIIAVIIIAIIVAVVIYYMNKNKKEVSTYAVRDIGMQNFWADASKSQGMVREDKMQAVYLSSTQKVDKILVKEGQKVKIGDPLVKYNTTLSKLELERKQLDIKKMKINLNKAQKELEEIKNYKPGVPTYGSLPQEPELPVSSGIVHDTLPNLEPPTAAISQDKEIIEKDRLLTGNGVEAKPYILLWENGKEYDKDFIGRLIDRTGDARSEVVALFMVRENNSITGGLKSYSKIKFMKKGTDYTFAILETHSGEGNDPLYPEENNSNNNPVMPEAPAVPEVGPIYTAAEITRLTYEKEKEISDLNMNIKVAQNEYKKLKAELENTNVTAKLAGIVKTVLNPESDDAKSKPIIIVSSGGGYYIQGSVSELALDSIKVGQKVNVQTYESGSFAEGIIEKISNNPLSTNSYYNGMDNPNVSYYPYTVRVEDSANLKEGEWASLSPVAEQQETSESFYLSSAFIISENGKNYVYISNGDKKLEKRDVSVGKMMHGLLEIRGGITMDDRVAFPYGKDVKEGNKTKESSVEELYSGM